MIAWLPKGKKAAICFSVDDIHPAKSSDPSYEGRLSYAYSISIISIIQE